MAQEPNAKITYQGVTTTTECTRGEAVRSLGEQGWSIVWIDGSMDVTLLARNDETAMVF